MTLFELVSSLKLHPSKVNTLYRFLRLLTHNGLFEKTTVKCKDGVQEETTYVLTPPWKLLITRKSTCLPPIIRGTLHSNSLEIWHSSKKWFNEDNEFSLFESATRKNFWEMLNKDSKFDILIMFQDAMAADSRTFKRSLKDCIKHNIVIEFKAFSVSDLVAKRKIYSSDTL